MSRRRRSILAAGALLATIVAGLAHGDGSSSVEVEQDKVDRAGFVAVLGAIDGEASFAMNHEACPADLFEIERPFWRALVRERRVLLSECEKDAMGCYRRCVESRSGAACFSLGRALQENEARQAGRYWEMLFARACAVGHAAGCTNRGAGIRNGGYAGDPLGSLSNEGRNLCLYRTFEVACQREDAWGCAMHGQSYHYGEGVAADAEAAARYYRRSCEINPSFAACRFARSRLAAIEGRPAGDDDAAVEH